MFRALKYEGDGIFSYVGGIFITRLWYKKLDQNWFWTPDDPSSSDNWIKTPQILVPKGPWKGQKPAFVN
jgi:hypothetical protein